VTLDGMQRVLEIHAGWLNDWREQLRRLETEKLSVYGEGPSGRLFDQTSEAIARLRGQIATIEDLNSLYRP
jgi:hypothetical protein